jgi:hypothetical protein
MWIFFGMPAARMPLGHEDLLEKNSGKRGFGPRVRVRAFQIPMVKDGAVIGLLAPVTRETMTVALGMMTPETFIGIEIPDDKVRSILVREGVLRRLGWDFIKSKVLRDIKPSLAKSGVLALKLDIAVVLGENFPGESNEFQQIQRASMTQVSKRPAKEKTLGEDSSETSEQYVRVRIRALEIPPVKDGIVIGRSAPMGADAMLRTLKLMSTELFTHLAVPHDNVVSDIIVRESVLRKLKEDKLRAFVLKRIKPLMAENELLLLDMEIEVVVEESL